MWIRVPGREMRRERIEKRMIPSHHMSSENETDLSLSSGACLSCITPSASPSSADEKGNAEDASDEDSEPVSHSSAHITMGVCLTEGSLIARSVYCFSFKRPI